MRISEIRYYIYVQFRVSETVLRSLGPELVHVDGRNSSWCRIYADQTKLTRFTLVPTIRWQTKAEKRKKGVEKGERHRCIGFHASFGIQVMWHERSNVHGIRIHRTSKSLSIWKISAGLCCTFSDKVI